METTGICETVFSPTLTAGQYKEDSQDSLSIEAKIMDDCLGFCDGKDEEGIVVVEAVKVVEVYETAIFGVSVDEDVLIKALL